MLSFEIAQEEMAQPTFTADHIRFWLHQLRELNPQKLEHRRRLINSFVNAVYLYDDYLVFVGNYKDSTKTITFAELEEIGLGSDAFASGVPKIKGRLTPPFYFCPTEGLERATPVHRLVQKLRAGEQFLARGRVHGWLTAGRRPVGSHPFRSATPGDCHGPYGPRNDIKREDLWALSFYFISNYQLRIRSNSSI